MTGCLFIAVVEKENTNGLLSDGGEEGVDFQISDRDGTRLTMGGDELRDWRGQYGLNLLNLLRDWHTLETGVTYMAYIG